MSATQERVQDYANTQHANDAIKPARLALEHQGPDGLPLATMLEASQARLCTTSWFGPRKRPRFYQKAHLEQCAQYITAPRNIHTFRVNSQIPSPSSWDTAVTILDPQEQRRLMRRARGVVRANVALN
nr:uncharacterized protein LOC129385138 [Dermacentor andersoni]